jgi:hypothetical protein
MRKLRKRIVPCPVKISLFVRSVSMHTFLAQFWFRNENYPVSNAIRRKQWLLLSEVCFTTDEDSGSMYECIGISIGNVFAILTGLVRKDSLIGRRRSLDIASRHSMPQHSQC